MLKSIEEEWTGFAAMVIPQLTQRDVQYIEMRKAFFAGAWSLHNAIVEIGEPHVSEEQGQAYLEKLTAEFNEFMVSQYEKPTLEEWFERWEAAVQSAVERGEPSISREEAERRYYQTYGRHDGHQNGEG